jgi:hypothetical protein
MAIFKYKTRLRKNLIEGDYYVVDNSLTSPEYFNITFFPNTIGGGKSVIKLRGNGANLMLNDEIGIEVLDAAGNPVYYEVSTLIDRFNQYHISISVFDDTAQGIGSISLTGKASIGLDGEPIPAEWQDRDNILWSRGIQILPFERNNSDILFSDAPEISVAQVIIPQRIASASIGINTFVTSSASNIFTITTANNIGFDQTGATDNTITDLNLKNISIDVDGVSTTVNDVDITTRSKTSKGTGFLLNKVNRYNTILKSSIPFFNSNYIGALFEVTSSSAVAIEPTISTTATVADIITWRNQTTPTRYVGTWPGALVKSIGLNTGGLPISGSLATQLSDYEATIVDVLDERTAILSRPLTLNGHIFKANQEDQDSFNKPIEIKKLSGSFQGVVTYSPTNAAFITSSAVSQSYIEFTFSDIRPIAGQVYKIRPFYKLSGRTGDYKLLTDQIIRPTEYLTDARFPNQTNYGKHISDYYLVGHFTETSSISTYWTAYTETPGGFGSNLVTINSGSQNAAIKLTTSASTDGIFTTNYFQNYMADQLYTITFDLSLDAGCELEFYMNSEPLNTNLTTTSINYPIAFGRTANLERDRYDSQLNRFGKLIGNFKNDPGVRTKETLLKFGKVGFDLISDADGLGKPMFRVKRIDGTGIGNAYISQISLTPTSLNGFTPNIIQFAVPVDAEITSAVSQSIDFKLEYFDYTGNQSEYVSYLDDVALNLKAEIATNACQAEQASWNFNSPAWHKETTASPTMQEVFASSLVSTGVSLASLNDGFFSSASVSYWPAIEMLQGVWDMVGSTSFIPHWATAFGLYNSNTDTPMWNVRRPILLKDSSLQWQQTGTITHSNDYPSTGGGTFSNVRGRITSSWNYVSYVSENFGNYFGNASSLPSDLANHIISTQDAAYENITAGIIVSSSIDNNKFYEEGAVGITRDNVSQSYYDFSVASGIAKTAPLKGRRLMFPMNGSATSSFFTTNGGIYNVKFKLKRSGSYSPDTGSFLEVYIFNNNRSLYTTSTPGADGWKPPASNIVTIGHAYNYTGSLVTPLISYFDPYTNAFFDEYDITLIQYGTPGNLCFDPGGTGDAFFGTLIDDISFCKIGVTTDPRYIKPFSRWQSWSYEYSGPPVLDFDDYEEYDG